MNKYLQLCTIDSNVVLLLLLKLCVILLFYSIIIYTNINCLLRLQASMSGID